MRKFKSIQFVLKKILDNKFVKNNFNLSSFLIFIQLISFFLHLSTTISSNIFVITTSAYSSDISYALIFALVPLSQYLIVTKTYSLLSIASIFAIIKEEHSIILVHLIIIFVN